MEKPDISKELGISLGLMLVTALCYWPRLSGNFIQLDTDFYILTNPDVAGGLTWENVKWAVTAFAVANWHPLTWMSHQLDCTLFGLDPFGHILHNLVLHAANGVLLFLLLRKMTSRLWAAAMAALIFILHPLNVEVVAWIAQRKSLLSTFLGLLCIWWYVDYVRKGSKFAFWASVSAFLLGLSAKPMLVTWPFVLLLLDLWPMERLQPAGMFTRDRSALIQWLKQAFELVFEKWPFFIGTLGGCILTVLAQGNDGAIASMRQLGIAERIANVLVSYMVYVRDLFVPGELGILYPHDFQMRPMQWVILSAVSLATITVVALLTLKRKPIIAVGWFLFLGTMVPVIGLVQVGEMTHADRYVYVPYIGLFFCLFFAFDFHKITGGLQKALLGIFVVWAGFLGFKTHLQARLWVDTPILYEHTIAITGQNPVIANNLGAVLLLRGDYELSEKHLRDALEARPRYRLAERNMALVLSQQGRFEEAMPFFDGLLKRFPDDTATHTDKGKALSMMGDKEEAITHFKKALALDRTHASAYVNLARTWDDHEKSLPILEKGLKYVQTNAQLHREYAINLLAAGQTTQAVRHFLRAIELAPRLDKTNYLLGQLYAQLGNENAAEFHYNAELINRPNDIPSRLALINFYERTGQNGEIRGHLERIVAVDPHHAGANFNLAQIHLREGRPDEAAELLERTLSKSPDAKTLYLVGFVREVQGNFAEAIPAYEASLDADSGSAETWVALAMAHARAGHIPKGLQVISKGLAMHNLPNLHNTQARLWLMEGESYAPKQAMEAAKRAYGLAPADGSVLLTLAIAMQRTGLIVEAKRAAAAVPKANRGPLPPERHEELVLLNQTLEKTDP